MRHLDRRFGGAVAFVKASGGFDLAQEAFGDSVLGSLRAGGPFG